MNDAANSRRAFQKELATARSKQGKTKNVYRDKNYRKERSSKRIFGENQENEENG